MRPTEDICKEEAIKALKAASSLISGGVHTFPQDDKYQHLRFNLAQSINSLIEIYKKWN